MAFSLSNWFKGKSNGTVEAPVRSPVKPAAARGGPGPGRQPATPPVTRNVASVRKVVPNSVQPVSLRDPSARGPMSLGVSGPAGPGCVAPGDEPDPPRKISFGNPAAAAAAYPSAPEPPPRCRPGTGAHALVGAGSDGKPGGRRLYRPAAADAAVRRRGESQPAGRVPFVGIILGPDERPRQRARVGDL